MEIGSSVRCAVVIALVCGHVATGCASPARATRPPGGEGAELVGEVCALQLHSAFWLNLHHVLYAEAWARRAVPGRRALAGVFPAPLEAPLTREERAAWDRAVAYYDRALASNDLLFDDTMSAIRLVLRAAAPERVPAGLAAEHAAALAAAAPVYRARWWPAHDRANRAWIADARPRVQQVCGAVSDRLARLYRTPWFATAVRVDVVFVASREGAYTSLTPAPAHITISSSDRDNQQWAAVEIVFHEASHALVAPVEEAFAREASAQGKALPQLWHAALFYLTGEVVRQALAARAIDYTPYLYATGLFERAWRGLRAPIEVHWRSYIDGRSSLDLAVAQIVSASPATR